MIYSQSGWAIPNYWINSDLRLTSSNNYHMKLMGSKDLVKELSPKNGERSLSGRRRLEILSQPYLSYLFVSMYSRVVLKADLKFLRQLPGLSVRLKCLFGLNVPHFFRLILRRFIKPNYRYSVGLLAVEVKSTLLLQTLVLGLVPSLEGVNILHLFLVMPEILVR